MTSFPPPTTPGAPSGAHATDPATGSSGWTSPEADDPNAALTDVAQVRARVQPTCNKVAVQQPKSRPSFPMRFVLCKRERAMNEERGFDFSIVKSQTKHIQACTQRWH